jgi:hypothetical protein
MTAENEVMRIAAGGASIRPRASEIREPRRAARRGRLIALDADEKRADQKKAAESETGMETDEDEDGVKGAMTPNREG